MESKPDARNHRSRRALLAGAAGAIAAAAVAASGGEGEAADGDRLVLGQENSAASETVLTAHLPGGPDRTLKVVNTGLSGTALEVVAVGSAFEATGLSGVTGISNHPNGVGVTGIDRTGHPFGRGVGGMSTNGWGVWAIGDNGQALRVEGRAVFLKRSGSAVISYPNKSATVTVSGPALAAPDPGPPPTPGSLVLAVLQTNLSGVYVRAAVPQIGSNRVTIYLNKAPGTSKAPKSVTVGWFVVN